MVRPSPPPERLSRDATEASRRKYDLVHDALRDEGRRISITASRFEASSPSGWRPTAVVDDADPCLAQRGADGTDPARFVAVAEDGEVALEPVERSGLIELGPTELAEQLDWP